MRSRIHDHGDLLCHADAVSVLSAPDRPGLARDCRISARTINFGRRLRRAGLRAGESCARSSRDPCAWFSPYGSWVFRFVGRFGFAVGAALIGSGFAFIIPAVVAWTLDIAPMRRRGLASGCATTAIFLGQFVSPLFSQRIIDQWDFRSLFLGSVILLTAQAGLLAALSFRSKKRLRANEWSLK